VLKAIASSKAATRRRGTRRTGRSVSLLAIATPDRLAAFFEAFRRGMGPEEIHGITRIDRWFLREMAELVAIEHRSRARPSRGRGGAAPTRSAGFTDRTSRASSAPPRRTWRRAAGSSG
jgi:hypothetical protein